MKKIVSTFSLVLCFFAVQQAGAQTVIEVGPRAGFDINDLNDPFIGVDFRIDTPSLPVQFNPTLDFYLVDEITVFQISANVLYPFGVDNSTFTPYAGAGLGITRVSVDGSGTTDAGLNIIGGAVFGFSRVKPFAQAQLTFGDFDLLTIGGGVLFVLGGDQQ